MYEATGLDFTPADLWLDENGELFMSGSIWGAVVQKEAGVPCCRSCSAVQDDRVAQLGKA